MNKFFNFSSSQEADAVELRIYGDIGSSFWSEDSVTAARFAKDLEAVKGRKLNIRINSLGGSVFDGVAIYNLLKAHNAEKVVYIDGIAASIASVIAMAGDKVVMPANTMIMIHDPWTFAAGNASELRKNAEVLDKIKTAIVSSYTTKTGMSAQDVSDLMGVDTWMNADEALAWGFADEVTEEANAEDMDSILFAADDAGTLSNFKNLPNSFLNKVTNRPKPDLKSQGEQVKITKDFLNKEHPEIVAELVQAAVAAERTRIQSVLEQSTPGHEALINAMAFDGVSTAGDAAIKVLAQEKAKRGNMLIDIVAGAPQAVANVMEPSHKAESELTPEEAAKVAWEKDPALQKEFSSFNAFLNWKKAEAKKGFTVIHRVK